MEPIQQQIYTNLAHEGLKPGHHTRDCTAGVDGAMKARFEEICNRWGNYEPGTEFRRALAQIPLWDDASPPAPPSHFLVILTSNKGRDSQGRLGAVLRHIVRIPAARYESLEYHPFRLLDQGQLLDDWSPGIALPDITPSPGSTDATELQLIFPERYKLLRVLLAQLLETGAMRIPVGSDSMAVEEVFAQVFTLTPLSWRPCLSLATYTFRNPEDYGLVAFHQHDSRVRRALEAIEEGDVPATSEMVDRYLTELFAAMRSGDWNGAVALIQGTALPDSTVPSPNSVQPGSTDPALPDAPSSIEDGASSTASSHEGKHRRHARAEQAHHPGWQGGTSSSKTGFTGITRWLTVLFLVVILGGAGWYITTRGGSATGGNGRADAGSALVSLRADGLASLLDRHEQLLGQMIADEVRDLDLREAMRAASQTLGSRVQQALTADTRRLDRQLSRIDGAESRSLETIAVELQRFVDAAAADHARVAALEQVLNDADPAALRAAYVDTLRRVIMDQMPPGALSPLGESLNQLTTALAGAAAGMNAMASESGYSGERWASIASLMDQAATDLPADLGAPPRVVRAGNAVVKAYVELRDAEHRAGLAAAAAAVPYSSAALHRDDVSDGARAFEARTVDLAATGAEIPRTLARVVHFHELGRESRMKAPASLTASAATTLLTELTEQCAMPQGLPCGDPVYGAHITRWKLEAWRAIGGPKSATGRRVMLDLGDSGLPDQDRQTVIAMVDLLNRMSAAPNPAPGELVGAVSNHVRLYDAGLFHTICTDWLARNQRQAVGQQSTFRRLYQRMQTQLTRLREADDSAGPQAFADLQATAGKISALDLASIEATGGLRAAARASRKLQTALSRQHLVRIARIDLELLRSEDYEGTRYREAHPVIRISRVTGVSQRALYEYPAPAMPAAVGAGFEPVSLQVRTAVPFGANETLLLTAHEPGGSVWFHMYIEPPRSGHVAAVLSGLHQVEVSADAMRAVAARPDRLPPHVGSGDVVASVRVILERGFWADLGRLFPDLP